ncbi:rod-binding protein [Sphingobium sp.]|uniref:rod-binding protein n=1 Tax=Sphingobium sp. TaxID=1912891 RepID=UPI003BB4C367
MQVATTSSANATAAATGTSSAGTSSKAQLEKAAKQFEAIFLRQMIGAMRSASLAEGISDSSATEQFQSMSDSRTADALANKQSMGIAQLLMKQFSGRVQDAPAVATPDSKATGQ